MYLELIVTTEEFQSIAISNPSMTIDVRDYWESDLLGETQFHISIEESIF